MAKLKSKYFKLKSMSGVKSPGSLWIEATPKWWYLKFLYIKVFFKCIKDIKIKNNLVFK